MSKALFNVTIEPKQVRQVLQNLGYSRRKIQQVAQATVDEVARDSADRLEEKYATAGYTSFRTPDINISISEQKLNQYAHSSTVTVSGRDVLFLEYGTGVNYPQTPHAPQKYKLTSWSYGPDGTGQVKKRKDQYGYYWYVPTGVGGHGARTYGNPAYLIMFQERKNLQSSRTLAKKARKIMREKGII